MSGIGRISEILKPDPYIGPFPPTVIALTPNTSANLARFYAFTVGTPHVVTKCVITTGAVASGNIDVGIYDIIGNRLASSGSTALAAVTFSQITLTLSTSVTLVPGIIYFAAIVNSTTIDTFAAASISGAVPNVSPTPTGVRPAFAQAAALPLPNPITPLTGIGGGTIAFLIYFQ